MPGQITARNQDARLVRMESLARSMARHWLSGVGKPRLLAHRENTVYALEDARGESVVLRLLRPGYNTYTELRSEAQWLLHLYQSRLPVPRPLLSRRGRWLHRFNDDGQTRYANATSFVPGVEFKIALERAEPRQRLRLWSALGALTASLHQACDSLRPDDKFRRRHWNLDALVGSRPLWGRFWQSPLLGARQQNHIRQLRRQVYQALAEFTARAPDYGLIHADLNSNNILCCQREDHWKLSLIDFDDGGFGHRAYDLMIALFGYHESREYPDYRAALFDGYVSARTMKMPSEQECDLLLLVRALNLLGWLSARLDDCTDEDRPRRALRRALVLARRFARVC